jgi:2-polyprenyl-6-methoxyphenol hydroxylase-like FAD-dependent oxidoreductase
MRIVVTGAGLVGLSSALLLAEAGHEVTVLERDAAAPPDPLSAWEGWERRGVNQVRLPHLFAPRYRALMEAELPDVLASLLKAGALEWNACDRPAASVCGPIRPEDAEFDAVTGRRVVVESVVARAADEAPGIEVRRGTAVGELVAGATDASGIPAVAGVRLESGEEIRADIVVDATGRRSPVPAWLAGLGTAPPAEETDDSGFVYYGRHFGSTDGELPDVPTLLPIEDYGTISLLALPADNATWSVVVVTSSEDTALRGLRDADRWAAVVRSLPGAAAWLEGEPIDDRVMSITKLEDRIRSLVVDGRPVVTGLLPVGDSWSCTNPSVGRGASIGFLHAVALRDLLADHADETPTDLALAWDRVTGDSVTPWYKATVAGDRHRLNEITALLAGREYAPDDPAYEMAKALRFAASQDPECARALFRIAGVLQLPTDALGADGVFEKVIELGAGWRDEAPIGPSREQLVALATA